MKINISIEIDTNDEQDVQELEDIIELIQNIKDERLNLLHI